MYDIFHSPTTKFKIFLRNIYVSTRLTLANNLFSLIMQQVQPEEGCELYHEVDLSPQRKIIVQTNLFD